jgi:hypothetical protein
MITLITFLAGAIVGSLATYWWRRNKLPDQMHIKLDIDTNKMADIFATVAQAELTAYYLDFPGLRPGSFCRIYFTDTKKRLEQTVK